MLRIKRYREQLKARALLRAQQQTDQQARLLEQARAETERFHHQRLREEREQFEQVRNQPVQLQRIQTMNAHAAQLREREALMREHLLERKQELEQARNALDQARDAHIQSLRACEKFEQFLDIRRALEAREQMLIEENELEEIASATYQLRQDPFQ